MPVFEYQCESCNKKFEVLQKNSNSYTNCSEINESCSENARVKKLISSFAFSGFSESQMSMSETTSSPVQSGGGCGCHGTASCPGSSIRSKYGLE
jgi:putative FmdB family regulatory protein